MLRRQVPALSNVRTRQRGGLVAQHDPVGWTKVLTIIAAFQTEKLSSYSVSRSFSNICAQCTSPLSINRSMPGLMRWAATTAWAVWPVNRVK